MPDVSPVSDEPREIRGYCGHLAGTLTGPVLVTVWCHECGGYVGTEWRDGKPVIISTQEIEPAHGGTVKADTWSDGDVRLTVTQDEDTWAQAVFTRDGFAALRELLDRAAMPGARVKHGPACGCTPCLAEPGYVSRRGEVPGDSDDMCDSCTCCSRYGCHGGPDSGCPTNSEGDFACPCTCD